MYRVIGIFGQGEPKGKAKMRIQGLLIRVLSAKYINKSYLVGGYGNGILSRVKHFLSLGILSRTLETVLVSSAVALAAVTGRTCGLPDLSPPHPPLLSFPSVAVAL